MKIKINSIFGRLIFEADCSSVKEAALEAIGSGVNLCGANLCGANLRGADLCGANLCSANLCSANLCGANLCDANLCGANLRGKKVKHLQVFSGLYRYQIMAILTTDGQRHVKMGCLFYSLEEWEKIGILKSNLLEFPNDGSRKSLDRAEAFEFAKNAALKLGGIE